MAKIPYDSFHPDLEKVRLIFFDWLRANKDAEQLPTEWQRFEAFVEFVIGTNRQALPFHIYEVFWQLVNDGLLIPGKDQSNNSLPWFRMTAYGAKVIYEEEAGHPHDPSEYLQRIKEEIETPDPTVVEYLSESLQTFRRGSPIASTLLLGIAAERVFLLVYESMMVALSSKKEKGKWEQEKKRVAMAPKMKLVHQKLQNLRSSGLAGYPDNAVVMILAIYDLMRYQRNDLGHPKETPPKMTREDAFDNLFVFRGYYNTAEQLRKCLTPGCLP